MRTAMGSFRFILAFCAIVASIAQRPTLKEHKEERAGAKAKVKAADAKQAKMSAVDKVVTMLETLKTQVIAEGEEEAASYNKFACFCKDTTAEKTAAIQTGEDQKNGLTADIGRYTSERDEADEKINELVNDLERTEKEMKEARHERAETLKVYVVNEADLAGALEGLEGAIGALKASKSPSLAQMQAVSKTVQSSLMLAEALGLGGESTKKAAAVFLQDPDNEVPMENYKFQSDGIIATLEKLLKDFTAEKNEVAAAEVKSVHEYDMLMQEKTDIVKAKNSELASTKKSREQKISEIATASEELTTATATLLDDQEYLKQLAQMCSEKAQTWDQRSKVRQDEIAAITSANAIIKSTVTEKTSANTVRLVQHGVSVRFAETVARDENTMEALEEDAEAVDDGESPPTFLQRTEKKRGLLRRKSSPGDDGRAMIADLLKSKGVQLKSNILTALAQQISTDPLAKVKVLIQELIERLLQESANEANQKGWCDKAIADAKQKRDYAAKEVADLNSKLATGQARHDKLKEELSDLSEQIKEIKEEQAKAEKMRAEEKSENAASVQEAEAGLAAVSQATDILSKFYKTSAKAEVTYSLAQDPADDVPDAGFDNGEAYTGSQGTAGGILGMLDVISSDFERTISETNKAEEEAEQGHLEFMTETGKSHATKEQAHKERTSQLSDTDEKLESDKESFKSQSAILNNAIKELLELHPTCIDTGMSYDERVARREDEIASLNKAECILERYAEFGPDGAADGC